MNLFKTTYPLCEERFKKYLVLDEVHVTFTNHCGLYPSCCSCNPAILKTLSILIEPFVLMVYVIIIQFYALQNSVEHKVTPFHPSQMCSHDTPP